LLMMPNVQRPLDQPAEAWLPTHPLNTKRI
jgi:hypothetical protein